MKRRTIAVPGIVLLCLPLVSNADMRVNPCIAGGATFGGDSVGSYTEFFWAEVTEVSVDAGETVFVYGGGSLSGLASAVQSDYLLVNCQWNPEIRTCERRQQICSVRSSRIA